MFFSSTIGTIGVTPGVSACQRDCSVVQTISAFSEHTQDFPVVSLHVQDLVERSVSCSYSGVTNSSSFAVHVVSFVGKCSGSAIVSSSAILSAVSTTTVTSTTTTLWTAVDPLIPGFVPPGWQAAVVEVSIDSLRFVYPGVNFPTMPRNSPLSFTLGSFLSYPDVWTWRA